MNDYGWPMATITREEAFELELNGARFIERSYSQAMQDIFVSLALDGKCQGRFLEIGAFDPVYASNSFLFESVYGWNGISIERDHLCADKWKAEKRKAGLIIDDATKINYQHLLKKSPLFPPGIERIDYLSIDIEPASQTFNCLLKVLLADVRFSIISFEHDYYANPEKNASIRTGARNVLEGLEYELVAGNICINEKKEAFEDWFVDRTFFDKTKIEQLKRTSDDPIECREYIWSIADAKNK
jgi:hypothetical protein